jgi:hypothetical protein
MEIIVVLEEITNCFIFKRESETVDDIVMLHVIGKKIIIIS